MEEMVMLLIGKLKLELQCVKKFSMAQGEGNTSLYPVLFRLHTATPCVPRLLW